MKHDQIDKLRQLGVEYQILEEGITVNAYIPNKLLERFVELTDDDFTIYLGKERFCTEMDKGIN